MTVIFVMNKYGWIDWQTDTDRDNGNGNLIRTA